ncbi:MAG: 50S ribosomal protein L24 [Candidatus Delongbacteria bacterium]|nr:50S ribosomal protein L24 [Candidatus Delongbacteria bacterium]
MKLHVRKNDTVIVTSGKYAGVKGKVLQVLPTTGKIIVEGVNFIKRHTKPGRKGIQTGGIIEREAPIPASKVMVYCAHCDRPVRVNHKILEDGQSVRTCHKCKEMLTSQ